MTANARAGRQCPCDTSGFTNLESLDNNCLNAHESIKLRNTTQYKNIGKSLIFILVVVN